MYKKDIFTTITTTYQIELIGDYSDELKNNPNFIEWIQAKACELGRGKQCEYYSPSGGENLNDDIEILFYVY